MQLAVVAAVGVLVLVFVSSSKTLGPSSCASPPLVLPARGPCVLPHQASGIVPVLAGTATAGGAQEQLRWSGDQLGLEAWQEHQPDTCTAALLRQQSVRIIETGQQLHHSHYCGTAATAATAAAAGAGALL